MADFGVNLGGDRIPPLEERRKLFRRMVMYLGLCGIVLIGVVYAGARDLILTSWHRADLYRLEHEFRQSHPGHPDILAYAAELEGRGAELSGVLDLVRESVSARADVAQMLAGITAGLPREIRLIEFMLDSKKGVATFDLAAPLVSADGGMTDPGHLVGLWNRDAGLASTLRNIQSVESHRRIVDGKPAFVLRFTGKLPGREG